MKKNVGGLDRALRAIVGIGLIGASAMGYLPAWGYIGIIPLFTSVIGWCPAYVPFGIKTCKTG